ncbi:MAG TPA: VanZ family protein [Pyrinomonadaceae bacterium]|nr:VanZ family protein [Pyrinomonadaceae bacterium]
MAHPSMGTRVWRYAPLVSWMLFIYLASTSGFSADNTSRILRPLLLWLFPHISEERIGALHFLIRKAAHFTEYAVLGFLAARAFIGSSHQVLNENWITAGTVLVVAYALLDEFHQSFVSARTASLFDSLIDIAGGLFALICFAYFNRYRLHTLPNR